MRSDTDMVAYALEVEPELLPFVPELLADLDELGSDADLIVEILSSLDFENPTRVLDLGCGKGAVSFEIAERLGFTVHGIDLFEPFIEICRQRAENDGLSHLCQFQCGNVRTLAGTVEPGDVALYLALGDVMGPLDETMAILRRLVTPGGLILIADDYLKVGSAPAPKGYEGCLPRDVVVQKLQAHGDVIIREVPESHDGMVAENAKNNALIRARAEKLAKLYPEMANAFYEFVQEQEEACAFMEARLVPVVWVVRRS